MFDITKLALKIPNFLTHEECDGLINEFEQRKEEFYIEISKNSKTNKVEDSNYKVISLKPHTNSFNFIKEKTNIAINSWIHYLDQPKYFFTDALKDNLKFSHSYRIMKYETGASIHPHSDHELGIYSSISFNLNDNYEGGEFKFFNGNYTIPLSKGDALIFPADFFWVHEVTKVTKGERYSINSFIKSTPEASRKNVNYLSNLLYNDYIQNTPPEELLGPYN
jgi:alkylated DNA repair dioxygenase AlkB